MKRAKAKLVNKSQRAGAEKSVIIGTACAYPKYTPVPFKEDDIVEVNDTLCKVKNVMLRKTSFRALDGKIITMLRTKFGKKATKNHSVPKETRIFFFLIKKPIIKTDKTAIKLKNARTSKKFFDNGKS